MNTQKPTLINVIAWMTLASGIVNLFWGIAAFTTFIGWVCAPLSVLPIILGIYELVYGAKLFSTPMQPLKPSTNIAVFEIGSILYGNAFSMTVGILALIFYNDTVVKDYFARLNGILSGAEVPAPVIVTRVEPASISQPEAAPAIEEPKPGEAEQQPVDQIPPPPEEPSATPKRTPRKVAGK